MVHRVSTALSALILISSSASSNIFSKDGKDPRVFMFRGAAEARWLEPVFKISTDYDVKLADGSRAKVSGTAFMVSPCLAFTNHHVVFGKNESPSKDGLYPLIAAIGSNAQGMPRYNLKAWPVKWGDVSTVKGSDWALIEVEKCPGRLTGWYELAKINPVSAVGYGVSMASIPVGLPNGTIAYQEKCILGATNGRSGNIEHFCGSRAGASGAPLLLNQNNKWYAIAINVGTDIELPFVIAPGEKQNYSENEAALFYYFLDKAEVYGLISYDIERLKRRVDQ